MQRIFILAIAIVGISFPVCAQQEPKMPSQDSQSSSQNSQSPNSQFGPDFPRPDSDRGSAFPKYVSPTENNPTNWITPPPDPAENPNDDGYRDYRGWRR